MKPSTSLSVFFTLITTYTTTTQAAISFPSLSQISSISLRDVKDSISGALFCKTYSQPNPIAKDRPNDTTGTINGTWAVVPIPIEAARSIIPRQYGILTHAYEAMFPGFAQKGLYPALLESVRDHDVGGMGLKIPDFSRIALAYPFVDRLNDGYTSFKYKDTQLISLNPVALLGSSLYGRTLPGTFYPGCDPYEFVNDDPTSGETQAKAYLAPGSAFTAEKFGWTPSFDTRFKTTEDSPYGMEVFRNLTNQPSFGGALPVCDNYITLFNTSLTMGEFAPVPVKGSISVKKPFYASDTTFTDVWGVRMDNAFIEMNFVKCATLQGYTSTGSGD